MDVQTLLSFAKGYRRNLLNEESIQRLCKKVDGLQTDEEFAASFFQRSCNPVVDSVIAETIAETVPSSNELPTVPLPIHPQSIASILGLVSSGTPVNWSRCGQELAQAVSVSVADCFDNEQLSEVVIRSTINFVCGKEGCLDLETFLQTKLEGETGNEDALRQRLETLGAQLVHAALGFLWIAQLSNVVETIVDVDHLGSSCSQAVSCVRTVTGTLLSSLSSEIEIYHVLMNAYSDASWYDFLAAESQAKRGELSVLNRFQSLVLELFSQADEWVHTLQAAHTISARVTLPIISSSSSIMSWLSEELQFGPPAPGDDSAGMNSGLPLEPMAAADFAMQFGQAVLSLFHFQSLFLSLWNAAQSVSALDSLTDSYVLRRALPDKSFVPESAESPRSSRGLLEDYESSVSTTVEAVREVLESMRNRDDASSGQLNSLLMSVATASEQVVALRAAVGAPESFASSGSSSSLQISTGVGGNSESESGNHGGDRGHRSSGPSSRPTSSSTGNQHSRLSGRSSRAGTANDGSGSNGMADEIASRYVPSFGHGVPKNRILFKGFCPVSIVTCDGLLMAGNADQFVARYRGEHYCVFHTDELLTAFLKNPDEYVEGVFHVSEHAPELLYILGLEDVAHALDREDLVELVKMLNENSGQYGGGMSGGGGSHSRAESRNGAGDSSLNASRGGGGGMNDLDDIVPTRSMATETPTHFVERYKDPKYEWNEWNLRRQALKLADLKHKKTVSIQSHESHFRREMSTQAYPPKDSSTQTMKDRGQNPVHRVRYVQGLRGHPNTKMNVVTLKLDL